VRLARAAERRGPARRRDEEGGEQGGALGSIGQLGSSIVEMQQHVDGLNKDLETLRKVKTALGG